MSTLDEAALEAALATRRFGRRRELLATCASTNDRAAELARAGAPEGTLVAADAQTGGRGRLGRVWHSPAGANLYLSIVSRPARPAIEVPPLTLVAGTAVARTLRARGLAPKLKWPNDVLLAEAGALRKASGILTEMASDRGEVRHVIVGIGLNVNVEHFPEELVGRATSLLRVTGARVAREALLAELLGHLETAYDEFLAGGPRAAVAMWRPHALLGVRCRVDEGGELGSYVATLVDVDDDGTLIVERTGVRARVLSGDVTVEP